MTASEFLYRCSEGHDFSSPKEEAACPGYRYGKPCVGEVERVDARGRRWPKVDQSGHVDKQDPVCDGE